MDHICVDECREDAHVPAPLCECHDAVTSIREDLDNFMTIVKAIHEEVTPTLDALKNSPVLKMIFPKEKRS